MRVTKFYSKTCQPCKTYGPLVDDVAKAYDIEVENVDIADAQQLVAQYGIRCVPALVCGAEVLVGAKSRKELSMWLGKL